MTDNFGKPAWWELGAMWFEDKQELFSLSMLSSGKWKVPNTVEQGFEDFFFMAYSYKLLVVSKTLEWLERLVARCLWISIFASRS